MHGMLLDRFQLLGAENDMWLADVQLIAWREDEREASSQYCKQVSGISSNQKFALYAYGWTCMRAQVDTRKLQGVA
jgi:hypothetical protein